MATANVLFYSNRCEGSRVLYTMMQNENLVRFFAMINTDDGKAPREITVTPTIILKGNPMLYKAGDAFNWLARVKQWKLNEEMNDMDKKQREYLSQMGHNLTVQKNQYLGFNEAEMSSMSDIFSFFSKSVEDDINEALPQSYQQVNTLCKDSIFAPPLENGSYDVGETNKMKEEEQRMLVNKMISERQTYEKQIKQAVKQFRDN